MGDKGDISVELIVRPKTPTILLQTQGGPVSWRQVGGKRRTMQLRASTAYCETLVDKWEASAAQSIQRAFADGKQLGAKLETGRQVWNQPDLQDKG